MILVDSRCLNAELKAALTSLLCWVGSITVWKHPLDRLEVNLRIPHSQRDFIEAESLEAAMQTFARKSRSQAGLIIVQREHGAACSRGTLAIAGNESVVYFPMHPSTPAHLQPPHEVLLVKATDFLDRLRDPQGCLSVAVAEPVQEAMQTAQANGRVVLDPLPALRNILDRRTLRQKLPDLLVRTGGSVAWSEALVVQDQAAECELAGAMRAMLEGSDGVLCKPCVACGISESHDMCLVRTPAGLPPHMPVHPFIVESVHNHSGVVFKCYAIKDRLFVHAKPSLADMPDSSRADEQCSTVESMPDNCRFHSITDMPCAPREHVDLSVPEAHPVRQAAALCAHVLAETTGLAMFGFDLVKPSVMDHYVLIDVNAFPSFKGTIGAAEALRELVVKRARRSGKAV